MFSDFEVLAGEHKYVSDFKIFLRESKLEDFIYSENDAIQVSTMHKAKGRELIRLSLCSIDLKTQVMRKASLYVDND